MTKSILAFFFGICLIASCKCNDKQVNDSGTTASANTGAENLKEMSAQAANLNATNTEPNEPGEPEMNAMYGNSEPARAAMAKRNAMRKKGWQGQGFYPEGSERKLTPQDIQFLTPWGQKVMLNEIYARHGMTFKDDDLKHHFSRQRWYRPLGENIYQTLSTVEKQNAAFLINAMQADGNSNKEQPDGLAANR